MDVFPLPSSGFLYLITFWCLIYVLDALFKRSRKYHLYYQEKLHDNGLSVSIAHIRWQTSLFNKYFMRLGRWKPKWLLYWFNLGVVFGLVAMVTSVIVLSVMLYKSMTETKPQQVLQPVMPGMNLPWNQVAYYLVTLIIAGAFHEVGHAVAAVREKELHKTLTSKIRENVRVNSFGLFVLFVYPGAFVELHTDQLEIITAFRKLRIYTAGVWHNFTLALVAYIFSCFLPFLLQPFYLLDHGVAVTWISQQSPIHKKLPVGDVITAIDQCRIRGISDWYLCLQHIQNNPVQGYCNTETYIKTHNTSLPYLQLDINNEWDCCQDNSSYRFCFYYKRTITKRILPQKTTYNDINKLIRTTGSFITSFREHACLPARSTLSDKRPCLMNSDCFEGFDHKTICLKPLMSNTTRLISISHRNGQDVLFVGDPMELFTHLTLANYVPIYTFSALNLPQHLHILSMYLLSISSALAILNMVPCFFLDGHQTLNALLELLLPNKPSYRTLLEPVILIFGSSLLAINIMFALYSLVK